MAKKLYIFNQKFSLLAVIGSTIEMTYSYCMPRFGVYSKIQGLVVISVFNFPYSFVARVVSQKICAT